MDQKVKINPAVAAIIVIVLVGVVASVVIAVNANKNDTQSGTTTSSTSSSSSSNGEVAVDSTDTSTYADGTYTATGSYVSPGGRESLSLTVTIKDGVITDTSMTNQAASPESRRYQQDFASNYKDLIVGKKVAGLSLSRVAGSSLTSNGFDDALSAIKNDAKA